MRAKACDFYDHPELSLAQVKGKGFKCANQSTITTADGREHIQLSPEMDNGC